MKSQKYYNYAKSRHIDLDKDGCDLNDWGIEYNSASYARHPNGFLIFISPDEIEQSDEYKDSDPYSVQNGISSDFQIIRFDSTISLLSEAVNNLDRSSDIKILDLGCGQGHITNLIKKKYPDFEVSGLDYSVSAIEYAISSFDNIDFIAGNAYEPPYSKEYFDVIILNNLWEHVPDPLYLLSKISTIIKPSGYLIISTPSRYRTDNLARIILGKPIRLMSKHHVTEYSVGQVIEQLRYGDFDIVKVYSKSAGNYNLKSFLAKIAFKIILSINSSHHQLESTIFYLAKKRMNDEVL